MWKPPLLLDSMRLISSFLCLVPVSFLLAMNPEDHMQKLLTADSLESFLPGGQVEIDSSELNDVGYRCPQDTPQDLEGMLKNLESRLSSKKDRQAKMWALQNKADIIGRICSILYACFDFKKMGIETDVEFVNIPTMDPEDPAKGVSRSPYLDAVRRLQTCVDRYFSLIFSQSKETFGKLQPRADQQEPGDVLFWLRRGEHFFVVPEERKPHVHQGTALWVPDGGKAVVFVYDQGKLIEDPGFIISHKKLASGAHYTKVSYFYGVHGEKAFQGSSLKRDQIDQNTFTESLWKSFFKDKTAGLYQYFVPVSNLGGADDSFFDLLNDEGFGEFMQLLPVCEDSVGHESVQPLTPQKRKKRRKKNLTVACDEESPRVNETADSSKDMEVTYKFQAESSEGHSQTCVTPQISEKAVEQIWLGREKDQKLEFVTQGGEDKEIGQRSLLLLESMGFKPTKWRNFWNFVNSVIKSLPEKPEVRHNGAHCTFSFKGMPSITIAKPHGSKDCVAHHGLRDFYDWLRTLVQKVCGLEVEGKVVS